MTSRLRVARLGRALGALLLAASAVGAGAEPAEVERLRTENASLRARVAELEAENAELRGRAAPPLAAALEARASAAVQEKPTAPGTTMLSTEPSRIERRGGGPGRHWLTLRAVRGAAAPEHVELVVETAGSGGVYRNARVLRLVVDGAAHDCPIVDYRTRPVTAARPSGRLTESETIVASVPRGVLGAVAGAHDVVGTLGGMTFRLTPEQLATFAALERRLEG